MDLIQIHPQGEIIHKGDNPNIDSYSAFFDNKKLGKTRLDDVLKAAGVTDCYVCGIATDVCVGNYNKIYCNLLHTAMKYP